MNHGMREGAREHTDMTWTPNERNEVDALWKKVHTIDEKVVELQIQTRLVSEQVADIGKDLHESNGTLTESVRTLMTEVRKLGESVLLLTAESKTKGHLIDRWLPLMIAAVAVGVSIWKI